MRTALRRKTIVRPGGVIEIRAPELIPGSIADVVVQFDIPQDRLRETSQPDAALDLGWPPDFFERTFGSLRDLPMVREDQGQYEVRDEIA